MKNQSLPTEEQLNILSPKAMVAYAVRNALRVLPLVKDNSVRDIEMSVLASALYSVGVNWDLKFYHNLNKAVQNTISDLNFVSAVIACNTFSAIYNSSQVLETMGETVSNQSLARSASKLSDIINSAIESISNDELIIKLKNKAEADYLELNNVRSSPFSGLIYTHKLWRNKPNKIYDDWFQFLSENNYNNILTRHREFLEQKRIEKVFWKDIEIEIKQWVEKVVPKDSQIKNHSKENIGKLGITTLLGSDLSDEDHLGRKSIVDAIASMVASEKQETPFTVGLLGEWGSGKSNVMHLIRKALLNREDSDRFYFTVFNAWQYEHTDNMTAGLAQEVLNGLVDKKKWYERISIRFLFGFRENGWVVPLMIFGLFILLGFSIYLAFNTGSQGWIALTVTSFLLLGTLIKKITTIFGHPFTTKINSYLKLPSYADHLGTIPILKRHIKSLCDIVIPEKLEDTYSPSRLIVFVDDLDRCEPEAISQILDAIRLVMDIKNVIIILGIDHRIAFRAIEIQYSDLANSHRSSADIARDYLGKIIQLPVHLNRPNKTEIEGFISQTLFKGSDIKDSHDINYEPSRRLNDSLTTEENFIDNEMLKPNSYLAENKAPTFPSNRSKSNNHQDMVESREEKSKFTDLADLFDMKNPRKLKRLRNCYRLLKRLRSEASADNFSSIMTMLFWLEYLYDMKPQLRANIQEAINTQNYQKLTEIFKNENLDEHICLELKSVFYIRNNYFEKYDNYFSLVKDFVLPHSDSY